MLDRRSHFGKMLIPTLFIWGLFSGAIALLVFLDFFGIGLVERSLIAQHSILVGIGLGSFTQIFAVVCLSLSMFWKSNSFYVPTTWALMGLSTGIMAILDYIYRSVILWGFILPHLMTATLPFVIVFLVGTDAMALLWFDSIKNIILLGLLFAVDKFNLFI